jgi:diguanylate cyclase (GGDEF)-like protein
MNLFAQVSFRFFDLDNPNFDRFLLLQAPMHAADPPTSSARQPYQPSSHLLWTLAFSLLALAAIGLVGYGSFTLQRYLARQAAREQLAVVSGLKVKQVQSWIEQEKSMAQGLGMGMMMSKGLEDWLTGGPLSPEDRVRILDNLRDMQATFGYRDVGLLSIGGKPQLSSTGLEDGVDRYDNWVLFNALLTSRPQITSVRWDKGTAGGLHLDVMAPLVAVVHGKEQVVALLRLRIDPNQQLFPLVQDWPVPTETAEALLAEIQGADVVFMSELRHSKGSALRMVFPINHPNLLAAQVARGDVDLPLEGRDYLEKPVLGIGRAIPDTQWLVIATQVQSEILKGVWPRTLLTSLIALGFVGVAFLSVRFWMKQRVTAQIQVELENQANTDRLTGLANRRRFESHTHQELRRIMRHRRGSPHGDKLAVVLVDVDHFKLYNDTNGHVAGDVCLRTIAEAIQSCTHRPGDLACRYGGEEFLVVLPDTDEGGALVVAEGIRSVVQGIGLPHSASPVAAMVTVSVGAAAEEVAEDFRIEALVEKADKALYAAKNSGRNRVVGSSSLV